MPFTPAATSGTRPIAFLGLAGVVHLDDAPAVPVRTVRVSAWGWWAREVAVPEATARQVAELAAWTDVVWISEWGHNAHTAFATALDLPHRPWPTLPVQFDKLAAVRAYATDLPWLWIDDPLVVPTTPTDDVLVLADTHDEPAAPPDSGRGVGEWTGSRLSVDSERGLVERDVPAGVVGEIGGPARPRRGPAGVAGGFGGVTRSLRGLVVATDPRRGLAGVDLVAIRGQLTERTRR